MNDDQGLSWLLQRFADEIPGVVHTQTVSTDGIHLASSSGMNDVQQHQFAAITSGISSLTEGAGDAFGLVGAVRQVLEYHDGWILISRISTSANLAVIADKSADLGLVGYEMTLLAERAGDLLSPDLIAHLKNTLTF